MPKLLLDFTGKTVLITGGATGIGRATAVAFGQQGAKVVIGDVADAAGKTVNLIKEAGGEATFVKTDVTNAESVQNLVKTTVETYGSLDVAFNNAGVLPPTASLAEQTEQDWDTTIAVDLKGVFLALKYEIAYMVENGGGSIINTASVAGVVADPDMAPYVAAKHGVVGLSKAAALEYAHKGIRVNALAPGLVATAMTKAWMDDPAIAKALFANNPMGRPAEPEEIAGTVLFLASDLASYSTGGVFMADGAQSAH